MCEMETSSDWSAGENRGVGDYRVYDLYGEKIGTVGELFVDDLNDQLEYIGVKTGLFGLRRALVPTDVVRIDYERQGIEVFHPKGKVKNAPHFEYLEEITAEFEGQVRDYFALAGTAATATKPTGNTTPRS